MAVGDSIGSTLSYHDDQGSGTRSPAVEPVLVLVLECGRPAARSTRHRLAGVSAVNIGRGSERRIDRVDPATGGACAQVLSIIVPDKWLSSKHARLELSFGRWVLVDTDSKNGSVVDGHSTKRAVLSDGSTIELGHSLFVFHERYAVAADEPADVNFEPPDRTVGLATIAPMFRAELARLPSIAESDIPVLLSGASGTGKEVLARAVHTLSKRAGEFVAVNCGALPDHLVESELFGHKRGAFSGAASDSPGLVRTADGGTLFLDEIGDLPLAAQAALLRVLQEREVMPVGATKPIAVNLRVVAATHRDLEAMIEQNSFRHDLYARLAGFRLLVPTLAERSADLGILIGGLYARLAPADHPGFDIDALRLLLRYPWPLNVRELEQALATAIVLSGASTIATSHLPDAVRTGRAPGSSSNSGKVAILSDIDIKVRDDLVAALRDHHGNVSAVARALDKDRKQIQRWLKRFNLDTESYR